MDFRLSFYPQAYMYLIDSAKNFMRAYDEMPKEHRESIDIELMTYVCRILEAQERYERSI